MRRWPHVPGVLLLSLVTLTLRVGLFFYYMESVQSSRSVVSDSLLPHGLQHARPPCPSPTPRACSNSCPLSQWRHPTISSSAFPFSSCLQSFPVSGSFQVSQLFASGGHRMEPHGILSAKVLSISELLRTPPTTFSAWGCAVSFAWKLRGERRGST